MASIPNMISLDIQEFLISTYKGTKRTITITQLSNIVSFMISSDIFETIEAISPNIINDQKPEKLKIVVDSMISTDSKNALKYLLK